MGVIEPHKDVLTAFGISEEYPFKPLEQGLINDTFIGYKESEPTYILQRLNTQVFTQPEALLANVDYCNSLLFKENKHYPQLIHTLKGTPFYVDSKKQYWRLCNFVSKSVAYNKAPTNKVAFEAGKLLAEFHNALHPVNLSKIQPTIEGFNDLRFRIKQHHKALENGNEERMNKAASELSFVKNTYQKLLPLLDSKPVRACHNDTKLNNMLFHKNTHQGLCIIDLDTLMPGHFFFDFGDAYRTIANTAEEGCTQLNQIEIDWEASNHFLKGFFECQDFLTESELKSLALGAVYMPFIHGLRALTDYIEGDVYYKVKTEDENLDRAKSLLHFSKILLENRGLLEEQIMACKKS